MCLPVDRSSDSDSWYSFSSASMLCTLQLFNCTMDYSKAQKWSKRWAKDANSTANGLPEGLCTGQESLARLDNTYSDVSQLRITYRSVGETCASCGAAGQVIILLLLAVCTRRSTPWPTLCTTWSTASKDAAPSMAETAPTSPVLSLGR